MRPCGFSLAEKEAALREYFLINRLGYVIHQKTNWLCSGVYTVNGYVQFTLKPYYIVFGRADFQCICHCHCHWPKHLSNSLSTPTFTVQIISNHVNSAINLVLTFGFTKSLFSPDPIW